MTSFISWISCRGEILIIFLVPCKTVLLLSDGSWVAEGKLIIDQILELNDYGMDGYLWPNIQFLRCLKFYFFAERYILRLPYIQKLCKSNKNCKASSQKWQKVVFEDILHDSAQDTKMAISQPLVDLDQNTLGAESYLVIGIHQCQSSNSKIWPILTFPSVTHEPSLKWPCQRNFDKSENWLNLVSRNGLIPQKTILAKSMFV